MSILPEVIMTRLPPGSLERVREACTRHQITMAEYARSALRDRLAADGLTTPLLDMRALNLSAPSKARKTG